MIFQNRSRELFLEAPGADLYCNFLYLQKGTFWTTFSSQKSSFVTRRVRGKRPCRDPVFHETRAIIVQLGPASVLKVVLGVKIDHLFSSVCYFVTNMFISIFHNTTVNVKPPSPLFLGGESRPTLKQQKKCVNLVRCVCIFSTCSYVC